MKYFLQLVADDLKQKFGRNFGRVAVVFPGKRASLFLNEYLKDEKPMFMPSYIAINELFVSLSPYTLADPLELVCRLYDIYTAPYGKDNDELPAEPLDAFFGWGEKLLADFDEIDKSMACAERLLQNLRDIKAFENISYLSEEQKTILAEYFKDFNEKSSEVKKKFLTLWDRMPHLYNELRRITFNEKSTYEGALYRDVVERLNVAHFKRPAEDAINLPADYDYYVFVGFNVLSKVEKDLFTYIKEQGKALFYWDYDQYYMANDTLFEAGRFLNENLSAFPNALNKELFNNFLKPKRIEFASAVTESIQAKSVTKWLEDINLSEPQKTAVVLCNESMLLPVLHSLPKKAVRPNITKGFPLSHTPAHRDLEHFFKVRQNNESSAEAQLSILRELQKNLKEAGLSLNTSESIEHLLYSEAYFKLHTIINRFYHLIERQKLSISTPTLVRLIRQVVHTTTIPFHGEPLGGVQIMGMLETRCLDFDNILMLSVGEGYLPRAAADASFIPYFLRVHYGLQTSQHQTAVYAYYFYRLLQRAKYVRLTYNKTADGLQKGEMSRFMVQLLCENRLNIEHLSLTSRQERTENKIISIAKPHNLPEKLKHLSPSALNEYLKCELSFYYNYVLGIRQPEDPSAADPRTFGTIFHGVAENFYNIFIERYNHKVTQPAMDALLGRPDERKKREAAISKMIEDFCNDEKHKYQVSEIEKKVLSLYLDKLFSYDRRTAPFIIDSTEKKDIEVPHKFILNGREHQVTLKGSIDRVDVIRGTDGKLFKRVVDYKTGGTPEKCPDLESIFDGQNEKRAKYIFQTLFYAYTLYKNNEGFYEGKAISLAPALFYARESIKPDFTPYVCIGKPQKDAPPLFYEKLHTKFEQKLFDLIEKIYELPGKFNASTNAKTCSSCPYRILCGR